MFTEREATMEPSEEGAQTKTSSGSQFPASQGGRGTDTGKVPTGSNRQGT